MVKSLIAFALLTASCAAVAAPEVVATGLGFPEGTVFVGNTLYMVDYSASSVYRLVSGKIEKVWHQDGCGTNGLVPLKDDLLVACYDAGTLVRISTDGKVQETLSRDDAGHPFANPNDLATDALGGVYFSASGDGKVFYRAASGHLSQAAEGINYSNGVVVSPDQKHLYVAESREHQLLSYTITAPGKLADKQVFIDLPHALADGQHNEFTPDGVRIDSHGHLFVGLYQGGGIAVFGTDGKLLKKVSLPAPYHSNLAISPDESTVYVTSTDDAGNGQLLKIGNPLKG